MDPNLLAMFARGAAPGQPPPSMMPPGMPQGMPPGMGAPPQPGMPQPGMPQQGPGMMPPGAAPPGAPANMPGPQAGTQATLPPGVGGPPRTAQPPFDPSRVIRPVSGPAGNRPMAGDAAAGRGGDSIMAHLTPGEIVVPPEAQTPEVLEMLNRVFQQLGANPTSFQAGHPDQKINPETGEPEFFLPMLLPLALSMGGSALLGPMIGSGLAAAGIGAGMAGTLGGVLGGGLGGFAGNLLSGKSFGESAARGALGAGGSLIGGQLFGGGGFGGGLGSIFGSGPTPTPQVGPGAGTDFSGAGDAAGAGLSATHGMGLSLAQTGGGEPSIFDKLMSREGFGSAMGGLLAGGIADDLFPPKAEKSTDTPIPPPGSGWPLVGGGGGAPVFPGAEYLKDYGRRPQFNYFPTA